MALGVLISKEPSRGTPRGGRRWAALGLALASASCVPLAAEAPSVGFASVPVAAAPVEAPATPLPAVAPAFATLPAAASEAFLGRTALDELRSLDCLAQAIYYEAASESEDGQRAVAQVVLNRVRHPAWPNSVCGVVYQGPMRAGGGCQFTFTCDGSLMRRPGGLAWARARQLAAEALAGRTFAPVGTSTHYHTHAVSPSWAPRLDKTMVIGAHNFYRLPGLGGAPAAFAARYSGSEPLPRPAFTLLRRATLPIDVSPLMRAPASAAELRAVAAPPSDIPQDPRWLAGNLPESTIREEYRGSGQWREDAPAAITGR